MRHLKAVNQKTKKELPFSLPERWEEISVKQVIELSSIHGESDPERIAVLTKTDKKFWEGMPDIDFYNKVKMLLQWTNIPLDFNAVKVPVSVKYNDRTFIVPTNLRAESVAQFEDMRVHQNKLIQDVIGKIDEKKIVERNMALLEGYCMTVAFYFQPLIDPTEPDKDTGSTYSISRANRLKKIIYENWSCVDVSSIGGFFLNKHVQSLKNTQKDLPLPKKILWKLTQGFRSFQRYMGFTPRSTH